MILILIKYQLIAIDKTMIIIVVNFGYKYQPTCFNAKKSVPKSITER